MFEIFYYKNVVNLKFCIMGKSFFILVTFFIVLVVVNQSNCLRCYACGEVNTYLGENYTTNMLPCREFDEATAVLVSDPKALERFAIECPREYVGCITQKQGGQIMRTCDTFAINDCQTANGVTYCYCNRDLCNGILPQIHEHIKDEINHDLTDDEDYGGEISSGFGKDDDDDNHLKVTSEDIDPNGTVLLTTTTTTGTISIAETRGVLVDDETSTKLPYSRCSRLSNCFGVVLFLYLMLSCFL